MSLTLSLKQCSLTHPVTDVYSALKSFYIMSILQLKYYYRKTSNIRRTLVDSKIVDHSDVVGAPPVGAAPTTSSFST